MRPVLLLVAALVSVTHAQFGGLFPPPCDIVAAAKCEYDFLQCRLFSGPADDPATMCNCGEVFFGQCLRTAGCMFGRELDRLSAHDVYNKICINNMMKYDCPSTLSCATNCASETFINASEAKIIPFNNYGKYNLRIRICDRIVHKEKLERYANVQPIPCKDISDFKICGRWIPSLVFTLVAIPKNTTYIEVDNCEELSDGTFDCHTTTEPLPTRVYGNQYIFASQFNVAQSNISICKTDETCLGSFCNLRFRPHVCSPKTLTHVISSGKNYFSTK